MTPKLPAVSAAQVIRALQRAGFAIHHQTGGHVSLAKPGTRGGPYVIVPVHPGDLRKGTLKNILRQADMDVASLVNLL